MKNFANLFLQLDRTNKTNEKVQLLSSYFATAPDADKIWALALFTGRRPPSNIKTADLHNWALEATGIPEWLYRECYNNVGDMAETLSLLLPDHPSSSSKTLSEWFHELVDLKKLSDEEKKKFILNAWTQFSPQEIFVFNKLMMGSFRIGVSQTLVIRALSEATHMEATVLTHRVMGNWDPFKTTFNDLIHAENTGDKNSRPYPFYLAYAMEGKVEDLGTAEDWMVEWKWDGIRAQIICRNHELYIWSRGEELISDKFPEFKIFQDLLPDGVVLDGEILCFANNRPLPFNILQTRIGRKNVTKKILQEAPAVFIAYDIIEVNSNDIRSFAQIKRREILEQLYQNIKTNPAFRISPLLQFTTWAELKDLHMLSRENVAEGFMLKRKNGYYQTGRRKGDWWKWKLDPLSIDGVLIYAQKGHGRRAEYYTDYTFAVWDNENLVPFAKAYSGLTKDEIKEVDKFIRSNTTQKFGGVRNVKPYLVFEIGFEGINKSSRHKSGIAVRFPRILRWRKDKSVQEADTIENLQKLLHHTTTGIEFS
ncbi:MAG TPA: ATP-dependent DNA ligase [Cyclobacteriaceae bacterium]